MKILKNIVVVGGGSSGWLTAAYLSHNFPNLNITIIDKEVGTPVGVGEATILTFKVFLANCGFQLTDWKDEIDATEKLGIFFPNWIDKDKHIYHPFTLSKTDTSQYKERLTVRQDDSGNVAYHVDCGKLTSFLKKNIINKVNYIQSDVKKIEFEQNAIKKIILKNNQEIYADLYIDCTGFKSLLKNKSEKIILKDRLICDTAIACHVNYLDKNKELLSYVICEAVTDGWVWTIPVQSRMGSGFIFNRKITDIEKAKDFFISYWNNRIKKENLKVLDWTPSYEKKMWSENVVSIGLSAGFIEPLESTGLALAMEGIFQLSKRITKKFYTIDDLKLFNKIMQLFFEKSIDFVNMHYLVSERKDVFWEQGRQLKKSEQFIVYNNVMENNNFDILDENVSFNDIDFFSSYSWYCWLYQSKQFSKINT